MSSATTATGDTQFARESTRLRSNVADRVQRDLLPAGRIVSMGLVICEMLAEGAVLIIDRGSPCDRPLRLWLAVLLAFQSVAVILTALNIRYGRDTFHPHRLGLSASDVELYMGAPITEPLMAPQLPSRSRSRNTMTGAREGSSSVERDLRTALMQAEVRPFEADLSIGNRYSESSFASSSYRARDMSASLGRSGNASSRSSSPSALMNRAGIALASNNDIVDRYLRIVNAWLLVWFVIGSIWISDGGTCAATAPHLYRLALALIIIYFALLFLPLTCFCLIVCCLPLFIIVYRILLPLSERERRRARAADQALISSLPCVPYAPPSPQGTSSEFLGTSSNIDNQPRDDEESCVICLCHYEPGELVCTLPCKHHFHADCISSWLRLDKSCALCKQDIDAVDSRGGTDESASADEAGLYSQNDSAGNGDAAV